MSSRTVKGSPDDVWAVLTDRGTWAGWWPLGAPQVVGNGWQAGSQLLWQAPDGSTAASASVDRADGKQLSFTFTSGSDGLPTKGDAAVSWTLSATPDLWGTTFAVSRLGHGRAVTAFGRLRERKVLKAEDQLIEGVVGILDRLMRGRADVPDVAALRDAKDLDGLLAAVRCPEAWVRKAALSALPWDAKGEALAEALVAAAADSDATVRWASVARLAGLDDEGARTALLRLCNDVDATVRVAAQARAGGIQATVAALETQPYSAEERARLRAVPGPQFGDAPIEPFLATRLAVYLNEYLVVSDATGQETVDEFGVRHRAVESKTRFPPVCAGCLEPTERSLLDITHALSWSRSTTLGSTVTTTTTNVRLRFPIRMCERCVGYGLDAHVRVTAESREQAFDEHRGHTDWVRFQFPNLAYYSLFCDNPDAIRPIGKKDQVIFGLRSLPKMGKADRAERDRALAVWERCRQSFGFHRYAALKHRLEQLEATGADVAGLGALAREFSVHLDTFRALGEIAGEPLPALRALGD